MSSPSSQITDDAPPVPHEDPRSPFESAATFSSAALRIREEEVLLQSQILEEDLRAKAVSQAERFLEWSKEWTSERCESIGSDLRILWKNEPTRLNRPLWNAVCERIELMKATLDMAMGETDDDDDDDYSSA